MGNVNINALEKSLSYSAFLGSLKAQSHRAGRGARVVVTKVALAQATCSSLTIAGATNTSTCQHSSPQTGTVDRPLVAIVREQAVARRQVEPGHGVLVHQPFSHRSQATQQSQRQPQSVHAEHDGDVEAEDPRRVPPRGHQRLLGASIIRSGISIKQTTLQTSY